MKKKKEGEIWRRGMESNSHEKAPTLIKKKSC